MGLSSKWGPFNLLAEYRIGFERFIFNYWDKTYDINRTTIYSYGLKTHEDDLYKFGKLQGLSFDVNIDIYNFFGFNLGYQNMQGEMWDQASNDYSSNNSNQTLFLSFTVNPKFISQLNNANIFYQQSNVDNPFIFSPDSNTIIGCDIGLKVSESVILLYKMRRTFIPSLIFDNFDAVETVQIETQFNI